MAIEFDDVKEVLERIIVSYGVKSRTELADLLSIPLPTINNWVARGSVPGNYIIQCSIETQANLEWLVTGNLANASQRDRSSSSLSGRDLYKHILSSGGKAVLQRIMAAYGFSMQKQLGDLLELSSGTISTWVRRDYFPGDVVVACALDTNVSLRWLATGAGNRYENDETQLNILELKSMVLTSGNLFDDGLWRVDPSFIPDSAKDACYVKSQSHAWIVDRGNKTIANGRWLLSVDGVYDVYEVTRMPANKIQVRLNQRDNSFVCNTSDVECYGQVVFTIERNY
ncbi:phage repressor protein CI [Citrobacter gillenii]|uniref:phage repressor protein CI n=1 Tax=Citrobacter gillenii TaxID=67828 RepID=UPI000E3D8B93|nr:phage repressor protein CI [Citrobacter gillenii]RFU89031.1 phage repressor protein CI [Citrobacter gillenii]